MTRAEFVQGIEDFEDLLDFCSDSGCDTCEGVVSADGLDSRLREELYHMLVGTSWVQIRAFLYDIEPDFEWYRDGPYGWMGLDQTDFDTRKQKTLDWCDSHNIFDDSDKEAADYESEDVCCPPPAYEGLSLDELYTHCCQAVSAAESALPDEFDRLPF